MIDDDVCVDGGDGVEDMHGIAYSMGSGDGVGGTMHVASHSDDVGLVCVYVCFHIRVEGLCPWGCEGRCGRVVCDGSIGVCVLECGEGGEV